jgi:hypothetical protein
VAGAQVAGFTGNEINLHGTDGITCTDQPCIQPSDTHRFETTARMPNVTEEWPAKEGRHAGH